MRDPYSILGVSKNASQDEIKKSYRRLARSLHPDMHPDNPNAEERFKDVTSAYDILSDPKKRSRYDNGFIDESGREQPGFNFSGSRGGFGKRSAGFDFNDMFGSDDFLGDIFRTQQRKAKPRKPPSTKGANISYTLTVSFEEATLGSTKQVSLTNGKSLNIRIPAGTEDGGTLRLRGQGTTGIGGGNAGDALIKINVKPHDFFTIKGYDVYMDLPITLKEAALGGKATVPTLHGKVTVSIPEGSSTGSLLRLKGKGIPKEKNSNYGDQLVRLNIMLPSKSDAALIKFLKNWQPIQEDIRAKTDL